MQKSTYSDWEMITSKVSAALFRSRMPSSACLIKLINFFVKRPGQDNIVITMSFVKVIPNYRQSIEVYNAELPRELS